MRFFLVAIVFSSLAACTAGAADSVSSAQADMASSPASTSTIVACADMDDPSTTAALTVDSSYQLSWQIGGMRPATSTLTDVATTTEEGVTSYTFHLASGAFISLSMGKGRTMVSFSALYAMCPERTAVDTRAIAPLLAATASSVARKQTFATCTFSGDGASVPEHDAFTVRPSLDGRGAIFEEASNEDNDQSFVLLARELVAAETPHRSIYKGQGGVAIFAAGQHVSPLTELTVTGSSPASIQWNWQEELPKSECEVTGAAYASSLLR